MPSFAKKYDQYRSKKAGQESQRDPYSQFWRRFPLRSDGGIDDFRSVFVNTLGKHHVFNLRFQQRKNCCAAIVSALLLSPPTEIPASAANPPSREVSEPKPLRPPPGLLDTGETTTVALYVGGCSNAVTPARTVRTTGTSTMVHLPCQRMSMRSLRLISSSCSVVFIV